MHKSMQLSSYSKILLMVLMLPMNKTRGGLLASLYSLCTLNIPGFSLFAQFDPKVFILLKYKPSLHFTKSRSLQGQLQHVRAGGDLTLIKSFRWSKQCQQISQNRVYNPNVRGMRTLHCLFVVVSQQTSQSLMVTKMWSQFTYTRGL